MKNIDNNIYKLIELTDGLESHIDLFGRTGVPTLLGEIFNQKVREYTGLNVVLSKFRLSESAKTAFIEVTVKSEARGHRRWSNCISLYHGQSNFGNFNKAILRSIYESATHIGLPYERENEAFSELYVCIYNSDPAYIVDDPLNSKKSDSLLIEKIYRLSSLTPYNDANINDMKATRLGKHFNHLLSEAISMNVVISSLSITEKHHISLNLYVETPDKPLRRDGHIFYGVESSCEFITDPMLQSVWDCLCKSTSDHALPHIVSKFKNTALEVNIFNYNRNIKFRFIKSNIVKIDEMMKKAFPKIKISIRQALGGDHDYLMIFEDKSAVDIAQSCYGIEKCIDKCNSFFKECKDYELFKCDKLNPRVATIHELRQSGKLREILDTDLFLEI